MDATRESPITGSVPGLGVSWWVFAAGVIGAASVLPFTWGVSQDTMPTEALRGAGWPAFAIAAALHFDRPGGARVAKVFLAVSLVPVAVYCVAAVGLSGPLVVAAGRLWTAVGLLPVVVTVVAVAGSIGVGPDRLSRRRLTWFVVWSSLVVACVAVAWQFADERVEASITTGGLWFLAGVVTFLMLTPTLRPVDEPLLDVVAGVAAVSLGAGGGLAVGFGAARAALPSPELAAAFAAVSATVVAAPLAIWARRAFLERRYGTGTLSPDDVAVITADLHTQTDPRQLLSKAAAMVAVASGHREVAIVLGADEPDVEAPWIAHPLIIANDRVGTLTLNPLHPEGPEPRQVRTVAQLLPTVALVARAVGLAVDATHARHDIARERNAERARILGDLHDGIGPALAGMSMRVQAQLRAEPSPWLDTFATELAGLRSDLRGLVSGLTPPLLLEATLDDALTRLVASFDGTSTCIELSGTVELEPAAEVSVAAYRFVAEGVTNALRHARAEGVRIDVGLVDQLLVVEVADDGIGGPISAGVGLTSLQRRAADLGGHLRIGRGDVAGTRLRLELPVDGVTA